LLLLKVSLELLKLELHLDLLHLLEVFKQLLLVKVVVSHHLQDLVTVELSILTI